MTFLFSIIISAGNGCVFLSAWLSPCIFDSSFPSVFRASSQPQFSIILFQMKAVILAGGYGTRISEETHLKPKPMVEIGGRPILGIFLRYIVLMA